MGLAPHHEEVGGAGVVKPPGVGPHVEVAFLSQAASCLVVKTRTVDTSQDT